MDPHRRCHAWEKHIDQTDLALSENPFLSAQLAINYWWAASAVERLASKRKLMNQRGTTSEIVAYRRRAAELRTEAFRLLKRVDELETHAFRLTQRRDEA